MIYHNSSNFHLSDDLERRLIQHAIEEQFRFRPLVALKNWIKGIFA
ncbi:hypothetical protein [Paenalcaligenes faecalis]|nr:hypothetical protein [Paenalcaligenes faecalis]